MPDIHRLQSQPHTDCGGMLIGPFHPYQHVKALFKLSCWPVVLSFRHTLANQCEYFRVPQENVNKFWWYDVILELCCCLSFPRITPVYRFVGDVNPRYCLRLAKPPGRRDQREGVWRHPWCRQKPCTMSATGSQRAPRLIGNFVMGCCLYITDDVGRIIFNNPIVWIMLETKSVQLLDIYGNCFQEIARKYN